MIEGPSLSVQFLFETDLGKLSDQYLTLSYKSIKILEALTSGLISYLLETDDSVRN